MKTPRHAMQLTVTNSEKNKSCNVTILSGTVREGSAVNRENEKDSGVLEEMIK